MRLGYIGFGDVGRLHQQAIDVVPDVSIACVLADLAESIGANRRVNSIEELAHRLSQAMRSSLQPNPVFISRPSSISSMSGLAES